MNSSMEQKPIWQAYITNNLGLGINKSLDDVILQKQKIIDSFEYFNQHNENINKLKYVEYAFDNDDLIFNEIEY